MAFRKYTEIGDVLVAFDLNYESKPFLSPAPRPAPALLHEEINYVLAKLPYQASEAAIGEMIIFPILKSVWRDFDERLMLWSHKSIKHSKDLGGVPDYLIARQSKRGKVVLDKPLLAVVEAKKDDFQGGWAQCALEMYAMQQINGQSETPVFGIVSNGDQWEFACLQKKTLTQMPLFLSLIPLDPVYAMLYALLESCAHHAAQAAP